MEANAPALAAENIRKTFGHFTALDGVSLSVPQGEFLTLFGPNGAGKTTLLKIAATLARPTSGTLRIEGADVRSDPERTRRRIGFLSHNTSVYRDLSPAENLRFFARAYGIANPEVRIRDLLERIGLTRRANDPVRAFSRGLQQRVGIARAILHDPSVILLDEPFTGLDAAAVETLNGILDEAVRAGKTVLLTTHDLEQGLRAATRAVIIRRGKIVFDAKCSAANSGQVRSAYADHVAGGAQR